jgi:hypothetical protein
MSAPTLLSTVPTNLSTDVILGTTIVLTFDQPIDTTTVSEDTFLLQGPGQTEFITPEQLASMDPTPVTGREYITGKFNWDSSNTVLTFVPERPLQPNKTYTVMVVGSGPTLSETAVMNISGDPLDKTYQWTFQTGNLGLSIPPTSAPLPDLRPNLNPADIKVTINPTLKPIGNDLSQEIYFTFPAPININTFSPSQFKVSVDAILNDIYVQVPTSLTYQVTLSTDATIVQVIVAGWPSDIQNDYDFY